MGEVEAGFAKLQGEDFEYYMQAYSIVLGRNSKKCSADVDLAGLGGGMNISRQHARIFYDFDRKRFAMEVLGKNGCYVEGILYLPGQPPIKLDSQDLLQIGDKKFYFLLPSKTASHAPPIPAPPAIPLTTSFTPSQLPLPIPAPVPIPLPPVATPPYPLLVGQTRRRSSLKGAAVASASMAKIEDASHLPPLKKGKRRLESVDMPAERKHWQSYGGVGGGGLFLMSGDGSKHAMLQQNDPRTDSKKRADTGSEGLPMQAEEKEVVSAVATVLSDLCGPGEWMPMSKLHSELVDLYSGIWPQSRVRKFLTAAEDADSDSKGRPWTSLLSLLRKYPEHFVINTRTKGKMTAEFVSLVSLLS